MQKLTRFSCLLIGVSVVAISTGVLSGCGDKRATAEPTAPTAQATVPPPPGDSTPKAIDSNASTAMPGNEKAGNPGGSSQSTTGSASSGAPPYSMQAGPEGNPSSAGPRGASPGAATTPNTSTPPSVSPNAPAPNTTSTEPNK